LALKIELGSPPGRGAVFELRPEGMEVVAGALGAECGEILDLEIARLFEVVIISNDVRTLLSVRGRGETNPQEVKLKTEQKVKTAMGKHELSLQLTCNYK
jgi:hypothetical protein